MKAPFPLSYSLVRLKKQDRFSRLNSITATTPPLTPHPYTRTPLFHHLSTLSTILATHLRISLPLPLILNPVQTYIIDHLLQTNHE